MILRRVCTVELSDEEREQLLSQVQRVGYLSCLKQALAEECLGNDEGEETCEDQLAPVIDAEEFAQYYQNEVFGHFSSIKNVSTDQVSVSDSRE